MSLSRGGEIPQIFGWFGLKLTYSIHKSFTTPLKHSSHILAHVIPDRHRFLEDAIFTPVVRTRIPCLSRRRMSQATLDPPNPVSDSASPTKLARLANAVISDDRKIPVLVQAVVDQCRSSQRVAPLFRFLEASLVVRSLSTMTLTSLGIL